MKNSQARLAMVYRFLFADSAPLEEVEETFQLSLVAAESLHGRASARLDFAIAKNPEHRMYVFDGGTKAGHDLCRIFTGLLIRAFGEDGFRVDRLRDDDLPSPVKKFMGPGPSMN